MEMIAAINGKINGFVWGLPMMILILGTGVYLSACCGFPQFTHFVHIMKNTLGKLFTNGDGTVTFVSSEPNYFLSQQGTVSHISFFGEENEILYIALKKARYFFIFFIFF